MNKRERITFITEALKQKFRHPGWKVYRSNYGTFRYDPFIFTWARLDFPAYSKSYPDNKIFTEKLVLGLERRDPYLIQITQRQFKENPQDAVLNQKFDQQLTAAKLDTVQDQQLPSSPSVPTQTSATSAFTPIPVVSEQQASLPEQISETAEAVGDKASQVVSSAPVQDLASKAQITAAKTINRTSRGLMDFLGSGVGAGGNFILKRGGSAINFGADLSNNISAGSRNLSSKVKKSKAKLILIIIGLVLFGSLLFSINPSNLGAPGGNLKSDIASCKFTRSDQNPKEASFKSTVLLGYIQQASNLTGIPAAILAAFVRVESPSSINLTDEQLVNYQCTESPTGALGIMQIQPPGTTSARGDPASCDDCIDAGAKLVGKTSANMTREDYCNPKTNIIVGAGWILKKMNNLGFVNNGKWNPEWTNNKNAIDALVNTYYGCLLYGGAKDCTGPYNYGDDVWSSMQSCKVSIQQPSKPMQPGNFSYYCQKDPRWSGSSYACETLGYAGCGPTSLAMVLSSFGLSYTPIEAAKLLSDNGYAVCNQGSALEAALHNKNLMQSVGLEVGPPLTKGTTLDVPLAEEFITKGYLIIGSSDVYPTCGCGHIYVVQTLTAVPTPTVYIRDPINCSAQTGQEFTNNREYRVGDLTWKYAYPVRINNIPQ